MSMSLRDSSYFNGEADGISRKKKAKTRKSWNNFNIVKKESELFPATTFLYHRIRRTDSLETRDQN